MTLVRRDEGRDAELPRSGHAIARVGSGGSLQVDCRLSIQGARREDAFLVWEAPGLRSVECVVEGGPRLDVGRWRNMYGTRVPGSSDELHVSIRYSCGVSPTRLGEATAYALTRRHFPHVPEWLTQASPSARLPRRDEPDFVLDVECSHPSLRALGPRYAAAVGGVSGRVERFAFYHGTFAGAVLIGPFVSRSDAKVPVFILPTGSRDALEPLVKECGDLAARIRAYFEGHFGTPPAPLASIVLYNAPESHNAPEDQASYCLGAAVVLNMGGVTTDRAHRRDRLLSLLAHECAHTWMAYGSCWTDAELARMMNEVLAITMEAQAIQSLGSAQSWETFFRTDIWSKTISAGVAPPRWLRTTGYYYGAMAASNLLVRMLRHRPHVVASALDRVWQAGRERILSDTLIHDLLRETTGQQTATAIEEALREPRPILARARIKHSPETSRWTLSVGIRTAGEARRLLGRLKVDGTALPSTNGREISYVFGSYEAAARTLLDLQPYHLVLEREIRNLRLRLTPWRARLWSWAQDVAAQPGGNAVTTAAAGLLSILLNPEDPRGYAVVAGVCQSYFPKLAGGLGRLAAVRAVYPDEARLREG
jgi:hypothetical protein